MEIKKPGYDERKGILSILGETLSPKYMPEMEEELERVINGEQIGFIMEEDNSPLGYITCLKTTETYKIETFAVKKARQKGGIGGSLLRYLESRLLETVPGDVIVLNVVTDNSSEDPAQEFYKKHGFEVSGIVKNEFTLGDEQVHMSKILRK